MRAAWLLALATLATLAGCGGGGAPSREEFAARADALCADGLRTTAPLQRQVREAARLSEPSLVFRRTAMLQRRLAAESAKVVDRVDATPHAQDDEIDAWVATLREARAARKRLADDTNSWDLPPDRSWVRRTPDPAEPRNVHRELMVGHAARAKEIAIEE